MKQGPSLHRQVDQLKLQIKKLTEVDGVCLDQDMDADIRTIVNENNDAVCASHSPETFVTVFYKTRHIGFFMKMEFDVSLISSTLELTHLRPIASFALEIASFVCDRATRIENERLRPRGVAMYAYNVSAYYSYTGSQLIWPGQSRSEQTQLK